MEILLLIALFGALWLVSCVFIYKRWPSRAGWRGDLALMLIGLSIPCAILGLMLCGFCEYIVIVEAPHLWLFWAAGWLLGITLLAASLIAAGVALLLSSIGALTSPRCQKGAALLTVVDVALVMNMVVMPGSITMIEWAASLLS